MDERTAGRRVVGREATATAAKAEAEDAFVSSLASPGGACGGSGVDRLGFRQISREISSTVYGLERG